MLTVETEVNGDSKSTNDRGPSLVSSICLLCRYNRFLFSPGCSSRPNIIYFFPHRTLFLFLCPQTGQAAVLDRLSLSTYLWSPATTYFSS